MSDDGHDSQADGDEDTELLITGESQISSSSEARLCLIKSRIYYKASVLLLWNRYKQLINIKKISAFFSAF
jgi:hypothetical protein